MGTIGGNSLQPVKESHNNYRKSTICVKVKIKLFMYYALWGRGGVYRFLNNNGRYAV